MLTDSPLTGRQLVLALRVCLRATAVLTAVVVALVASGKRRMPLQEEEGDRQHKLWQRLAALVPSEQRPAVRGERILLVRRGVAFVAARPRPHGVAAAHERRRLQLGEHAQQVAQACPRPHALPPRLVDARPDRRELTRPARRAAASGEPTLHVVPPRGGAARSRALQHHQQEERHVVKVLFLRGPPRGAKPAAVVALAAAPSVVAQRGVLLPMGHEKAPAAGAHVLGVRAQLVQRADLTTLRRPTQPARLGVEVDVRLVNVEVLWLADERAVRLLAVAPGAAEMVEQLLHQLGRSDLEDAPYVLMVDAHPERLVRHHDTDPPF